MMLVVIEGVGYRVWECRGRLAGVEGAPVVGKASVQQGSEGLDKGSTGLTSYHAPASEYQDVSQKTNESRVSSGGSPSHERRSELSH